MTIDLEQLKAAAQAAGGGQWTSSDCTVWFDDGDSALRVGTPAMLGLAFDNMGAWPDPIDREDIAAFSALACPATVLALIERLEQAEGASNAQKGLDFALIWDQSTDEVEPGPLSITGNFWPLVLAFGQAVEKAALANRRAPTTCHTIVRTAAELATNQGKV